MFSNKQINIDTIDQVEDLQKKSIQSCYKSVILLNTAILLFILLALVYGFFQIEDEIEWRTQIIVYSVVSCLVLLVLTISMIGFKYRKYALREHDIMYENGWLLFEQVIVPLNRLQHVKISQGILMRKLGLASITLHTAGNANSAVKISGLNYDDAVKIKTLVASKMLQHEAEEGISNDVNISFESSEEKI